jgi:L-ascorbate metabolism protein UlaG (beta-lactamase superfamily)
MTPTTNFNSTISITHIGTATSIINIDGVRFLTDPVFGPAGTYESIPGIPLTSTISPALTLDQLPVIDCVLLSHEDHDDNLDTEGRKVLDGRHVLTTMDGEKKLQPRPAVKGLKPWETVEMVLQGKKFRITGTPCQHFEIGECTGFVIETDSFGHTTTSDGVSRPNAVYVSGDTIYIDELKRIREKWHVAVSVLNFAGVLVPFPSKNGELGQITFDGASGAQLHKDLGADKLVPMHFEEWKHFVELKDDLKVALEKAGVADQVVWLKRAEEVRVM